LSSRRRDLKMKRKTDGKRCGGFTLVEMAVSLVLFSFVVVSVYSIFNSSQKIQSSGLDLSQAQQNARIALDTIEKDLRLAGFGISPTTQVPILVASEYRVTFVRDANGNGTVDLGETITYFLDTGSLDFISHSTPNPRDMVLRRLVSESWNPNAQPTSGYGDVVACSITQQTDDDGSLDVPMFDYLDENGVTLLDVGADDPYSSEYGHTISDSTALGRPIGGGNNVQIATIAVTIVAEGEAKNQFKGDYERVTLTSSVAPRNLPLSLALAKVNP
jgi:prepilin-type N-terminal cleavage/methylation domain-containing protein